MYYAERMENSDLWIKSKLVFLSTTMVSNKEINNNNPVDMERFNNFYNAQINIENAMTGDLNFV